jgi:hypothetical protein
MSRLAFLFVSLVMVLVPAPVAHTQQVSGTAPADSVFDVELIAYDPRLDSCGGCLADHGFRRGRFFAELNGSPTWPYGYHVFDDDVPLWTIYQEQGTSLLGPPISQRWVNRNGTTAQAFGLGLLLVARDGSVSTSDSVDGLESQIPDAAKVPQFFDEGIPLASDFRLNLNFNSLDLWRQAATALGQSDWQMIMQA